MAQFTEDQLIGKYKKVSENLNRNGLTEIYNLKTGRRAWVRLIK